MHTICTSKDGSIAAAYQSSVARLAVRNLQKLYPGERIWTTMRTASEVARLNVEILETMEDAEIVKAFRVSQKDGHQTAGFHRETLRGLVQRRGSGNSYSSFAEGLNVTEAQHHLEVYLASDLRVHGGTFRLDDLLGPTGAC